MKNDFQRAANPEFVAFRANDHVHQVPIGVNINYPESIEEFTQDPNTWSAVAGKPVIPVTPDFADFAIGSDPQDGENSTYTLLLEAEYKWSDETPEAQASQENVVASLMEVWANEYFDEETRAKMEDFTQNDWLDLAQVTRRAYEIRHSEVFGQEYGFAQHSMGYALWSVEDGRNHGFVVVGDTEDYEFDKLFTQRFRDALGVDPQSFGYDAGIHRAQTIAHELEHLTQSDIVALRNSHGENMGAYQELDANIAGDVFIRDVMGVENAGIYQQLEDLGYMYGYTFGFGQDLDRGMRVDHHNQSHINQFFGGDAHLTHTPDEIHEASISLGEKILEQMGFPPPDQEGGTVASYEDRLKHLEEHQGLPTFGQMRTALSELISSEQGELSAAEMQIAGSLLDSMDTLGVEAQPTDDIAASPSVSLSKSEALPPINLDAFSAYLEPDQQTQPPSVDDQAPQETTPVQPNGMMP